MIRLVILRLLESYFRRRWLYLVPVVVMTIAAVQYIAMMPAKYVASGTMYIQNDVLLSSLTALGQEGFGWSTPAQATSAELYQLLNAGAFLRAIAEKTDLEVKMGEGTDTVNETLGEIRQSIWIQQLGSNLVLIGASHEMPRVAYQLTTAAIDTYIQWKINMNHDESVAAQTFFADLIKTYRAAVEPARSELARYLQEHPKPVRGERTEEEATEITRLQAAVNAAEDRLRHAQDQEENARLALVQAETTVRQTYFVMDAPQRPLTPERSKKDAALSILLFLCAGAAISGIGIVGGALLDRTFRFPIDVQHGLNLPVLAMVGTAEFAVSPVTRSHNTPNASYAQPAGPTSKGGADATQNGNNAANNETATVHTNGTHTNGVGHHGRARRRIFG